MNIQNSALNDIPEILNLYRIATQYMKSKDQVSWPEFPVELIEREINEGRQWKLVIEDKLACIWASAQSDELIWGNANMDPSVYLHRIATNPDLRGQNFVQRIVDWADEYCVENNLKYVRMDTVGYNEGLISHYGKFGFELLKVATLETSDGLPDHYSQGEVCYFQREVRKG